MLLDYLVLAIVVGLAGSAVGCGVAGLIYNNDGYTSASFVNLLAGLAAGLLGLAILLPAVYCKMEAIEAFVVPVCLLLASLGFLATAGIQKRRELQQGV